MMKYKKYSAGILFTSCAVSSIALYAPTAEAATSYNVWNNMSGVQMCFNSVNTGANQPSTTQNIQPGQSVTLSTGGPNYWSGVNYNLRPSTCSCSDAACTYLGNLNVTANADGVTDTETAITVQNFALSRVNFSDYSFTGSYAQSTTQSQTVTNQTNYLLCNGTVNPSSAGVTYPSTNKGAQGTLDKGDSVVLAVKTPSFFSGVNFNIRRGGCTTNDAYYGNLNISTSTDHSTGNTSIVLSPIGPQTGTNAINMSATCTPFLGKGASYGCNLDTITLTPPAQVVVDAPKTYIDNTGIAYRGANLAGSEFGEYFSPGNVPYPSEVNYYIDKGMNTVRLPIRWAYLQPKGPGMGPLDPTYVAFIENILEDLTQAGVHVVVDLHDYQRYSPQGKTVGVPEGAATGSVPNGMLNTPEQLASIWTSLISGFQLDNKINMDNLIFDISNEPAQMNTRDILANENAAIGAIRATGATKNLILVEGNVFSGLWAWEKTSTYNNGATVAAPSSTVFRPDAIIDPNNNYAINVHQYFDSNNSMSGTTQDCIPANTLLTQLNANNFLQWVQKNKMKVFVSEFGVGRGSNQEQGANCMSDLSVFLNWAQKNAYTSDNGGFVGWTIWSAGHAWGGYKTNGQPSYILDISPNVSTDGTSTIDSPQVRTLVKGGFLN
ncbi:MAG: glycoside hydrolase family 5 protein [Gammaproteobacteria bacterium]|nr:glycoside hydrolase family 5 protein [Gammaproteobacteria bacterium]